MPLVDLFLFPVVFPAAFLMKAIRRIGVRYLPMCRKTLVLCGVFPIRDHFYEPLFNPVHLSKPLSDVRNLPGIEWNEEGQLAFLNAFRCEDELRDVPSVKPDILGFYFNNGSFESGDAEYLYQIIRHIKPAKILEIGSGNSTLMAMKAVSKNNEENPEYTCEHTCIEPYKQPWLEQTGLNVIRRKVEEADRNLFSSLGAGDILFIDSSHVIRPQGDVLLEYLELLPTLKPGVIVHIHDIFSPRDYPHEWVIDDVRFWNEQYLLESFLTSNRDWKIIGSLNYLHHTYYNELKAKCPFLTPDREPGSFYIQKKH